MEGASLIRVAFGESAVVAVSLAESELIIGAVEDIVTD
jgi:hypothetical protein